MDPVLGDHGKPYQKITAPLIEKMKELVSYADFITPNATEAALLTSSEYKVCWDKKEALSLLERLNRLGPSKIAVTGVELAGHSQGVLCLDTSTGAYFIPCRYLPASFPGTGDAFTAATLGFFLRRQSLQQACTKAARFLEHAIRLTLQGHEDPRYGVFLEPSLPYLWKLCEEGDRQDPVITL